MSERVRVRAVKASRTYKRDMRNMHKEYEKFYLF